MGLDADFDDNLVFIFSLAFLYLSTKVSRKSRIGLRSETHTHTYTGGGFATHGSSTSFEIGSLLLAPAIGRDFFLFSFFISSWIRRDVRA